MMFRVGVARLNPSVEEQRKVYARLREECRHAGVNDFDQRVKARVTEAERLLCGTVQVTPEMFIGMAKAVHAECMRQGRGGRQTHGGRPGVAPSERELMEEARNRKAGF